MHNYTNDLLTLLLIILAIMCLFFMPFLLYACFSKFSEWRIRKNRKHYFNLNKQRCAKSRDLGKALIKSYRQYEECIQKLSLNQCIECSNAVVSNSASDPVKYILKYSNISNTLDDIKRLEFISNFFIDYLLFIDEMTKTGISIRKKLPIFYKLFANKRKLPFIVCDLDFDLFSSIERPFLLFSYTSPAGRSQKQNKIVLDILIIEELVSKISESINKRGHTRLQRSMMTNDLREAIKKRDNYTCCKCGNSIYNEPNLLLEVDHIIPVSKGGKTEASNLQTLCWRCNRIKSDK